MTPQSLRDPQADAAAAAHPDVTPDTPITVEVLGRRLGRHWEMYNALGKQRVEIHKAANVKEIDKRVVERREGTNDSAIDACVQMITTMKAGTLTGAAIQVMLAYSQLDAIAECEPESATEFQRKAERCLFSALAVIVREAGIDLSEFGGKFYAQQFADPFPADAA